ncbi:MAG TPA: ribosome maturation factor RimM [Casimicrobiaceae bacterium]|nr:ribosome maturation factor RimM [Casimicrobiaceae bacterium]
MGRIGAPHGVRGAFRVRPESADPTALVVHREWWLRTRGGEWRAFELKSVRVQADMIVAEVAGIETREAAAALRGGEAGIPRERFPPPRENEFYEADLVGMAVVNREGVALGVLREFIASAAHPIARVVADDGKERLIPWVDAYIDRVDEPARRIDVDWAADE